MKKSLLIIVLMALLAPTAMNAQTRSLEKKVLRAPRPQLQLEAIGQLQTIENFQPGVVYHKATMNTRDEVLYTNGFEEGEYTQISIVDNDGDGNNWGISGDGGIDDSYCAYSQSYINGTGAVTPDNWIIMPAIELPSNGLYFASIYAQSMGGYGETIGFWVAPEGDEYMYQVGSDFNLSTGEYELCEVNLTAYAGQTIQVIIRHYNCTDGWYLLVDNFSIYETIPSACDAPIELSATDITSSSATLSWTGFQDDYNIQYRTAAVRDEYFFDDFEQGTGSWSQNSGGVYNGIPHSGDRFVLLGYTSTDVQYLITPELSDFERGSTVEFYQRHLSSATSFMVGYSSTTAEVRAFTWGAAQTSTNTYTLFSDEIPAGTKYIAIQTTAASNEYALLIDDFGVYGPYGEPGQWVTVSGVTSPYTLEDLSANTEYDWQVQGNCTDGQTDWSTGESFTTLPVEIIFINDGEWNVAKCWKDGEVPADGSDVTIAANAIIPAGYDAIANVITIQDGGSITIQDGGQLHSNNDVVATVEKEIAAYTGDKDNYYLIASPLWSSTTSTSDVRNLLSGTFDFYSFDGTEELEWRNHQVTPITAMNQGEGYLYANASKVTLSFSGTVSAQLSSFIYNGNTLTYNETMEFGKWNLVGNLLPHNGYPYLGTVENGYVVYAKEQNFYTMKSTGDEIIVAENGYVKPAEGIFVEASGEDQYVFWSSVAHNTEARRMNINVSSNGVLVDRASLRIGEGNDFSKLQLNPNHTKLFFNKDNKDYAVVYSEGTGEMPVNFKAEKNGTYTLSFSTDNVEFGYLHLIDNMTGADIDLLQTPSYTFDAKVTDYASRFKIVFNANNVNENNSNDSFAFYNNGNIIVNGNGTLNIVDMLGRRVLTQELTTANCQLSTSNFPAGVYMLQLVNGDNVKTQKVVVK